MSNDVINDAVTITNGFNSIPIGPKVTRYISASQSATQVQRHTTHDLKQFAINLQDQTVENIQLLTDFLLKHNYGYETFLIKDESHYSFTDSVIGTGDGATTTFQMAYTPSGSSYSYSRWNIKANSQTITAVAGVQTEGVDYTIIDNDNARVVFIAGHIPASGNITATVTEYYRRVYLIDPKSAMVAITNYDNASNNNIILQELEVSP